MVTHNGQRCVVVAVYSAYKVQIHTRSGARTVEWTALRETTPGEIREQMKRAREGRADNSELFVDAPLVL